MRLRLNELLTVNDESYDNYGLVRTMGRVGTCDFPFQNENHMLGFFVNFYFIYFLNFFLIFILFYFVLIFLIIKLVFISLIYIFLFFKIFILF